MQQSVQEWILAYVYANIHTKRSVERRGEAGWDVDKIRGSYSDERNVDDIVVNDT